jgi:hypothetical protein
MKILIINGPNMNLVGKREEDIYGSQNFTAYLKKLRKQYPEIHIDFVQTNIEGEIIDALHKASLVYNGIILNAGGYTHTSVAIADAIRGNKYKCDRGSYFKYIRQGIIPSYFFNCPGCERKYNWIRDGILPVGVGKFQADTLSNLNQPKKSLGSRSENFLFFLRKYSNTIFFRYTL